MNSSSYSSQRSLRTPKKTDGCIYGSISLITRHSFEDTSDWKPEIGLGEGRWTDPSKLPNKSELKKVKLFEYYRQVNTGVDLAYIFFVVLSMWPVFYRSNERDSPLWWTFFVLHQMCYRYALCEKINRCCSIVFYQSQTCFLMNFLLWRVVIILVLGHLKGSFFYRPSKEMIIKMIFIN